jgi:hypothetical protein
VDVIRDVWHNDAAIHAAIGEHQPAVKSDTVTDLTGDSLAGFHPLSPRYW